MSKIRSVAEFMRPVVPLQTSDENQVVTPEGLAAQNVQIRTLRNPSCEEAGTCRIEGGALA